MVPLLLFLSVTTVDKNFIDALGPQWPLYLMIAMATLGLVASTVGEVSIRLANERSKGWNRVVSASPLPRSHYIAAKLLSQWILLAVMFIVLFGFVDVLHPQHIAILTWIYLFGWMLFAAIPCISIGLLIGMLGTAAQPVAAIGTIVLSFLGGIFVPMSTLPESIAHLSVYIPTYCILDDALRVTHHHFSFQEAATLCMYALVAFILTIVLDNRSTR